MSQFRNFLRRLYWKLEDLIDPDVMDAHRFYANVVRASIKPGSSWLEVGCGHDIFVPWAGSAADLVDKCHLVVGIDYDLESLKKNESLRNRVGGDLLHLPCRDMTFDHVTANMVMEHVADPVVALKSIDRLLKPGGTFIFHTPNYWHYCTFLASLVPQTIKNKLIELAEERSEDDVFPTFYRFNTAANITAAAENTGFRIRELHKVSSSSPEMIFILGPLVAVHLLLRRLARWKYFENFRDNFIVVLEKSEAPNEHAERRNTAGKPLAVAG